MIYQFKYNIPKLNSPRRRGA